MELLAPAGTFECVIAAVNSGADAVYFAGQSFGARSFAGNLSDEEIAKAADFCHLRGAAVYVTVNTLLFDKEFKELEKFIKTLTRAGVDGVIVQDLGVADFIHKMAPDIEIHGSTQMTVHSLEGVRELEKHGFKRVVLSRELSAEEIEYITKNAVAETEVFVHGAMCMSYSGQCLMSSVIGGRSGNRGKCAQPCRLPYSSNGSNPKFYLSLKDMSLAEHLESLSNAGVASLKVEGRMKGSQYVASVISAYRKLIDERRKPTAEEMDELNRIFFRGGLTDGYFKNNKGKRMFAFDKPDNPYLKNTTDKSEATAKDRKRNIKTEAAFFENEVPWIKMSCDGYEAVVFGEDRLQKAAKRPLDAEDAKLKIEKLGDTAFRSVKTQVKTEGEPFMPVSALNELRRSCAEKLESEILKPYKNKRILSADMSISADKRRTEKCGYSCSVLTVEQYRGAKMLPFEIIYVPLNLAVKNIDELLEDRGRIVISLPVIIRYDEREAIVKSLKKLKDAGFDKAEISTLDALDVVRDFKIYTSQRMNITNSYAFKKLCDMGVDSICLSCELNLAQMRDIVKACQCEAVVYGRIPLMITENCILKNIDKCPCNGLGYISDRTGARLPIIKDGDACRSIVLNSVPLWLGDKKSEIHKIGADRLRLIFTTESEKEVVNIGKAYMTDETCKPPEKFTRLRAFKSALE